MYILPCSKRKNLTIIFCLLKFASFRIFPKFKLLKSVFQIPSSDRHILQGDPVGMTLQRRLCKIIQSLLLAKFSVYCFFEK